MTGDPFATRSSFKCPHCTARARIRTNKDISPLYREIHYQCLNVQCGHVFVCGLEVLRTTSPSAIPDPTVHIPLSRNVVRREVSRIMAEAPDAPPTKHETDHEQESH